MNPPHLADQLLKWFCAPHLLEDIQGDLHEEFEYQVKRIGLRRARRRYWWEIIGFMKPGYIKRKPTPYPSTYLFSPNMLLNYLKIAWRQLINHKAHSFINLSGLVAGLTTCFIIFLWAVDEYSFNKFHHKIDRIYQVMVNDYYPDGKIDTYGSPAVKIGDALRNEIPEVDNVVQCSWEEELLVKNENNSFLAKGMYADSSLFDVFSFPVVLGDAKKPLPNTNTIAISESLAKKFFNNENPIGKTIEVKKTYQMMVSSVFKDIPENSSIKFDFIISFGLWKKENNWANHWRSGATRAFVSLLPNASFKKADNKVRSIIKNNCSDCNREAFLTSYSDTYLSNKYENGKQTGGRIEQVNLFLLIALVILIIACINFLNLATARAMTRFKEIGVRKATGATQKSLQFQFLIESILIAFIAMLISIVLVLILIPWVNSITGKSIIINLLQPSLLFGMIGITLFCGLLAGLYPALYLSGLKTIYVLKYKGIIPKSSFSLRKTLVVFQFTACIILLIGSTFIYKQVSFIFSKDLGYRRENIIVLNHKEEYNKNYASFRNDLLQIPSVKTVAFVGSNIFQIPITTTDPVWAGKPSNSSINFKILRCDEGFIPATHIKLQAGRNFTNLSKIDSSNYIINEKAMLAMGLTKENVIGSKLEMWNGKGEIIGLTNDFVNGSLYESNQPLILMYSKTTGFYHFIETIENTNTGQTLSKIENIAKKYAPEYPFEYKFLDEVYNQEYSGEVAQGKLLLGFTIISLIICCLGLFGLSTIMVERKIKEIGVRKVLGASVVNITTLLSKDFIKLVLIANVIAFPIAWWATKKWLQGFAYHIEISWLVFAFAGILAILIALLTVSFQAIKAAVMNPVKSLKTE